MTDLVQLNLSVDPDLSEHVEELAREYGWTKRQTITLAIRALGALMDAHKAHAVQHDADIADLYLRLAAEVPAGFVEVPKDGVRVGRAAGVPAVMIDDRWLVFPDETGALLAEEQGGEKRIARVVDGEIKPVKLPSPEEVTLN